MTDLVTVHGEPMGGYADRAGGVGGELEPLQLHAVVFTDATTRFALLVVDVVCLNVDVVALIRQELSAEHDLGSCWVAATHTHSGPETGCHPGGGTTNPDLARRLVAAARTAVAEAIRQQRPGSVEALPRVAVVGLGGRRSEKVPAPVSIPVAGLLVRDPDGRLSGVLTAVPVHPTVLPADNLRTAADLSGGIRRAVSRRLGSANGIDAPWVVAATGAAGDISTRHTRRSRDIAEIDRLADLVAVVVADGLAATVPRTHDPDDGVRGPVAARLLLEAKQRSDIPALDRIVDGRSDGATRTFVHGLDLAVELLARERPAPHPVVVEAVTIGPVTLVAVPGELFLELGERIRAEAPEPDRMVVLGYTNGYVGYLPSEGAFDVPDYEVLVSPVRRGSGERVVAAAADLTAAVASGRGSALEGR